MLLKNVFFSIRLYHFDAMILQLRMAGKAFSKQDYPVMLLKKSLF